MQSLLFSVFWHNDLTAFLELWQITAYQLYNHRELKSLVWEINNFVSCTKLFFIFELKQTGNCFTCVGGKQSKLLTIRKLKNLQFHVTLKMYADSCNFMCNETLRITDECLSGFISVNERDHTQTYSTIPYFITDLKLSFHSNDNRSIESQNWENKKSFTFACI